MILCFMMLGVFLLLFVCSQRVDIPEAFKKRKVVRPFLRISIFLMGFLERMGIAPHNKGLKRNLEGLYRKKEEMECYYIERMALVTAVLFVGLGISFAAELITQTEKVLQDGMFLERPDYGEGSREADLNLKIEGEEETSAISVQVGERQYTNEQKKSFLKKALEEMDNYILGENKSLDEIRQQLILPETLLDGKIKVEWVQEPYGILDEEGKPCVEIPKEGKLIKLTATLDCGGEKAQYTSFAKILPPQYTKEEEFYNHLRKELESANMDGQGEQVMKLPEVVDGRKIIWSDAPAGIGGILCAITMITGICIYKGKDREIAEQAQARRRQLIMDYPDVLFKLSILLGAGLTIKGAFSKIALQYKEHREDSHRYVYEEMLAAYYEMQGGLSEASAYESFGNRCQESRYIKLGTTLAQNLKKGSQGLTETLQNDALLSMEERRQIARKVGEEAGTKLLLPMVLMLVVVLVILMVPAVMSF